MSDANIAKFSKENQDKVAIDLVASAVAYKERLNMPVVPEVVARVQPEHLREYFMEWCVIIDSSARSCRTQMLRSMRKWLLLMEKDSREGCR